MDGINPTLAFAALFFGLTGNAHHATQTPLAQDSIDCPVLVLSSSTTPSPTQQTLSEAFEINLPGVAGLDNEAGDGAFAPAGLDPIVRKVVPVGSNLPLVESEADPCAPER